MRIKEFSGKGGELRLLSTLSPSAWKNKPSFTSEREKEDEWKDRFTRIRECKQILTFWSGSDLQGIKKIPKRRRCGANFYLRLHVMMITRYLSSNKNNNPMWLSLTESQEGKVRDGGGVRSHLKMNCQQIQLTRERWKSSLIWYLALSSGRWAPICGVDLVLQFGSAQHGLEQLWYYINNHWAHTGNNTRWKHRSHQLIASCRAACLSRPCRGLILICQCS